MSVGSATLLIVCTFAAQTAINPPGVPPHEPSPEAVVDKALHHFKVSGDTVSTLRLLARMRGLVPRVSGTYFRDNLATQFQAQTRGDQNLDRTESTGNETDNYLLSVEWDFRDLVFNPSEVDVYSLVSLQRDLILEVSRTYYLRQQLMIQRATSPPTDAKALHILNLRIREFTTLLDAFTGGWFSRAGQSTE